MAIGHWLKNYLDMEKGGTELPEATSADNGKVLGVENGEYALVEGGGNVSIATYTANSGSVVAIEGNEHKQVELTVPSSERINVDAITGIDVKVTTTKGSVAGVMCSLMNTQQSGNYLSKVIVNIYNTEAVQFQPYVLAYVHYLKTE